MNKQNEIVKVSAQQAPLVRLNRYENGKTRCKFTLDNGQQIILLPEKYKDNPFAKVKFHPDEHEYIIEKPDYLPTSIDKPLWLKFTNDKRNQGFAGRPVCLGIIKNIHMIDNETDDQFTVADIGLKMNDRYIEELEFKADGKNYKAVSMKDGSMILTGDDIEAPKKIKQIENVPKTGEIFIVEYVDANEGESIAYTFSHGVEPFSVKLTILNPAKDACRIPVAYLADKYDESAIRILQRGLNEINEHLMETGEMGRNNSNPQAYVSDAFMVDDKCYFDVIMNTNNKYCIKELRTCLAAMCSDFQDVIIGRMRPVSIEKLTFAEENLTMRALGLSGYDRINQQTKENPQHIVVLDESLVTEKEDTGIDITDTLK